MRLETPSGSYCELCSADLESGEPSPEQMESMADARLVLLVDDDDALTRLVELWLTRQGYVVEICSDGTTAIESLESHGARGITFDLVISDVRMPDRNGYEVFRAAKDLDSETPVILMTGFGYDPHHSIVRSSQEGLHCFLFKPFQVEQLLEEVYKALVISPDGG